MAILMPHAARARKQAIENQWRLVHYASAETALKILDTREFWLRDSRCMNDFMEVQTGLNHIKKFFSDPAKRITFSTAVDACHPGLGEELIGNLEESMPFFWANTYIMCFSVHKGGEEDKYGRLSMWRAYGRASGGAAIVFNAPTGQSNPVPNVNVFLSPVAYRENIDDDMAEVINNIVASQQILAATSRADFRYWLFSMFAMAAVCLKHPGFREEEEWRLVHLPSNWKSEYVSQCNECIDGIPQYVYKLRLSDLVAAGNISASPINLINKVIVGPTAYPGPISEQFFYALRKLGFPDPSKLLEVTYIPLRM
jgi:hypothetical protein